MSNISSLVTSLFFFWRSIFKPNYVSVIKEFPISQQWPIFVAPGTGFMEDNFSMDQGRGNRRRSSGLMSRKLGSLTHCLPPVVLLPFLIGHRLVLVLSSWFGDLCYKPFLGARMLSVKKMHMWMSSSCKESTKVVVLRLLHQVQVKLGA